MSKKNLFRLILLKLIIADYLLFLPSITLADDESRPLIYISFDDSTKNQITNQDGEVKQVKRVAGKIGQAGLFEKGSYIRFPAKGNINFTQGTVELWFKPNWSGDGDGDTYPYHYFFAGNISDAKNLNSIHFYKKPYAKGAALGLIDGKASIGSDKPETEAIVPSGDDLSPVSTRNWKKGEWIHLAFSWDKNNHIMKIYFDGILRASHTKVSDNAYPINYQDSIYIGSSVDQTAFAEGVIDEFKLWGRPLTDMEIAKEAGLTELGEIDQTQKIKQSPSLNLSQKEINSPALITILVIIAVFGFLVLVLVLKKRASRH